MAKSGLDNIEFLPHLTNIMTMAKKSKLKVDPKAGKRIKAAKSMHEQAAEILRNMIVEGELAPGLRLPERELCELLGVSRTPLREAIKVLASEGLVQLSLNRGATVTGYELEKLDDTLEMVALLESAAARWACAKATDKELKNIQQLHEAMVEYSRSGDDVRYFRTNQHFHEAVVAASHNDRLRETHATLNAHLKRLRYQRMHGLEPRVRRGFIAGHDEIAKALKRRDAAAAERAVLSHMSNVGDMLSGR
jgi:DNA-binding GntR family transcriptional regulator